MRKAFIFYHFLPPDQVVSAILMGELAAELVEDGWDVTAFTCNRDSRNENLQYASKSDWNGVHVRRLWRPPFKQSTSAGRILNAIWMIARWSVLGCNPRLHPDVLIVGSDPVLSVLIALVWRIAKPRARIVHWCFDLYPEAAIADGLLKPNGWIVWLLKVLMKKAYSACDLIVDIGSRMQALLRLYKMETPTVTLPPWALQESIRPTPIDFTERRMIFGECQLALMYSGSLGKAHSYGDVVQLARSLRHTNIRIAFSIGEQAAAKLRKTLSEDQNIIFVPTVPTEHISTRLSSADIHIVTLKENWTGIVVPSKFFGALAIGRPVLFCGRPDSDIARLIIQYRIGWVLAPGCAHEIAREMSELKSHPEELQKLFEHCFEVYTRFFSKAAAMASWKRELRKLAPARDEGQAGDVRVDANVPPGHIL